jgi:hypothetical protein
MTDRLVTRKQVNEMYGFSYCGESYRRWEKPNKDKHDRIIRGPLLKPVIPCPGSRVHYWLSNVIAVFGPVPTL